MIKNLLQLLYNGSIILIAILFTVGVMTVVSYIREQLT